ncbi:Signal transduction histidine kinase [Candidatus Terasakiella magnetica]|nr:Signal transduction histidine kinase [Candidatus Terasakiella magnetica]
MFLGRSIKIRITVLFFVSFLIVGWIISFLLARSLQTDIEELLSQQQFSMVTTLTDEIDQKIRLQVDALDRVANLIQPEMITDSKALNTFLGNRIGVRGFFSGGLVIANMEGQAVAEYPARNRVGSSFTFLPLVQNVLNQGGGSVLSEPFMDPVLGEPAISVALPIRHASGRTLGVMIGIAAITQNNFLGKLGTYKIGQTGGLYVVAPGSDMIVMSTNRHRAFTQAPARGSNTMLDRFRDGYEGSGVTVSSVDLEELTSGRRIPVTGWILVARLPTSEAFEPIARMKNHLILAMLALSLLTVPLLWLVVRRSLKPLATATFTIREMVDGSRPLGALEQQADAEVGDILSAFNALQAKLRKTEHSLREREEVYRKLFDGCRAVEMLIDPADGRIVDANAAASAYYGWTHDQLLRMHISDINTLSPDKLAQEMELACKQERDYFRFCHRLASGATREVEAWAGPIELGERKLLCSIIHDVSERVKAERDVHRLLEFRRAILDGAGASIIATDIDGTILHFNPTAEQWLGYAADDMVGRQTPMVIHDPAEMMERANRLSVELGGRVPVGFETFVASILHGNSSDTDEWTYIRKDGSRFRVLLTITALYDEGGDLSGFLGIAHDITERLEMERELQRSNTELEHFAYVASHDLRQPLRMISSYLTLLDRKIGPHLAQEDRESFAFAVDGARRMDRMITDLLAYSRIGRGNEAMASVPLDNAIDFAVRSLSAAIAEAGAEIVVISPLPVVVCNPVEIERLFQNLIANAVKFRAEGRAVKVEISWRQTADEWIISIKDNGIGIAKDDQPRLFQVFQRLVPRAQYDGTGIGLASCRKIAEHCGGRIWLDSEQGQGSTFHVALPIRPHQQGTAPPVSVHPGRG